MVIKTEQVKSKLKSRKFWLTVLTMIATMAGALKGVGGTVGTVACIIGVIVIPVIYVLTEGRIDAKSIQLSVDAVEAVIKILTELGYLKKEDIKEINSKVIAYEENENESNTNKQESKR